jgi:hypothetical protein
MGIRIHRVETIHQHPHADGANLTLVRLAGLDDELVANKLDDGSFRYQPGDLVMHIAVNTILPDDLLKTLDLWRIDSKGKGKGTLGGNKGNRMVKRVFAETVSLGMMTKVRDGKVYKPTGEVMEVQEGDDVSEFFGTTEYVP